jgi:hypothetical protein
MSIQLMTQVYNKFPYGGNKKLVLLSIADHASDDGFAWPSVELIAVKCNVSKRYVQEITAELVELGWLRIRRPDADNGRITNLYEVIIPEDAIDAVAERRAAIKARQQKPRRHEQQFIVPEYWGEPEFTPGVNYSSPKSSLETSVKDNAGEEQPATAGTQVQEEQERLAEKDSPPASLLKGRSSKTDRAAADAEAWAQLTEGQRYFLECFGAKRYKTKVQSDTVAELEKDFGLDRLAQKVRWAAQKGMAMGNAIVSVESALRRPNGKQAKQAQLNNPGKPGRSVVDVTNITGRKN